MITLDRLRAALRHPQPWSAMNELVRAEQAAGRKVEEIHDELRALVEPVRAAENPSEDADDAMMDAIDALAGNCRSESAYHDPPRTDLPVEDEIVKLPKWARVAFAARCARRVLPLYTHYWVGDVDYHRQDVWHAIESAELSAAKGEEFSTGRAWAIEAAKSTTNEFASSAAWAAADAMSSMIGVVVDGHSARQAAGPLIDLTPIIHHDFDHLARLAEAQCWTHNTPVPPDVFGPLWPKGAPKGWPVETHLHPRQELQVVVLALEKIGTNVIVDEVVNIFNTLNRYYIARTGNRLTLEGDIHTRLSALVGAGV